MNAYLNLCLCMSCVPWHSYIIFFVCLFFFSLSLIIYMTIYIDVAYMTSFDGLMLPWQPAFVFRYCLFCLYVYWQMNSLSVPLSLSPLNKIARMTYYATTQKHIQ